MTPPRALETAAEALASAAALAGLSWSEVDGDEAVAAADAVTRARSVLDGVLLQLALRIEQTDAVRSRGWASTQDLLTHLTGGLKGSGAGLVRTAEQLRHLPAVQAALDAGDVSLPQARAIAGKVAGLPRDPELRTTVAGRLLDLVAAHGHDASDLQTAFADVVREVDPHRAARDAERQRERAERGVHHARHLSFALDELGGVRVRGYGTVEDAERIKTALMPLSAPVRSEPGACGGQHRPAGAPLFDADGVATGQPCLVDGCGHDGRDPRDHGARLWDALVDLCDLARDADRLPRDHGSVPTVVVTIDHQSLRAQVLDAGRAREGELPGDARLSAAVVRRLACDARIVPVVLGAEGLPLDVGRRRRLVTAAMWTALVVRDRHCAFPGCGRLPLACDAHHVVHWADGGATDLDNLVMLCRHHHVLVHRTPWAVHIDPRTGRPGWAAPPRLTLSSLRGKMSYVPARGPTGDPPPLVA